MGWGYRKTRRIAPGVRLNLSRRSLGVSVGRRGARLSANSRGGKTLSLSRLGFFWRKKL